MVPPFSAEPTHADTLDVRKDGSMAGTPRKPVFRDVSCRSRRASILRTNNVCHRIPCRALRRRRFRASVVHRRHNRPCERVHCLGTITASRPLVRTSGRPSASDATISCRPPAFPNRVSGVPSTGTEIPRVERRRGAGDIAPGPKTKRGPNEEPPHACRSASSGLRRPGRNDAADGRRRRPLRR